MNIRKQVLALFAPALLAALVSCGSDPAFVVSGTVAGLVGPVVLQVNGGASTTVSAAGAFTVDANLPKGGAYELKVASSAQNCSVANGSGTVVDANITNVVVNCTSVVRSALLAGANENPAVTTAATGRGAVVVDPNTRVISGGMTFSGLTPSSGGHHIHQAPAGNPTANGPVIIPLVLSADARSAMVPGGVVLTDAQYAALVAGELYFNVHTAANAGGEIRGQINARGVTAAIASMSGAQEVPANSSTASGRGTLVFDPATLELIVAYDTHTVTGATVSHIHTGLPGAVGPANVVTFSASGASMFVAPAGRSLTPQNVIDLRAGNLYFNVHSATYPGGEVRGVPVVQ